MILLTTQFDSIIPIVFFTRHVRKWYRINLACKKGGLRQRRTMGQRGSVLWDWRLICLCADSGVFSTATSARRPLHRVFHQRHHR